MTALRIKRLAVKALKGMGALLVLALTGCVLYLVVITTDTPERQNTLETAQTKQAQRNMLPEGANRLDVSSLSQAAEYFDGMMLVLADNSGFQLISIEMRDWQPEGASEPVRELRLGYAGASGTLWVCSISPVSYLASLPIQGYTPVLEQGITLAGLQAVLLESSAGTLRVFAQADGIVYEMEGALSQEALSQLAWQARLIGG